jgi:hypothetical protein
VQGGRLLVRRWVDGVTDQPLTAPTDDELTIWLREAQQRKAAKRPQEYGIMLQIIRLVAEVRRLRSRLDAIGGRHIPASHVGQRTIYHCPRHRSAPSRWCSACCGGRMMGG